MEFEIYRTWVVRVVRWCVLCNEREANEGSDECARCQGIVAEVLRRLEEVPTMKQKKIWGWGG